MTTRHPRVPTSKLRPTPSAHSPPPAQSTPRALLEVYAKIIDDGTPHITTDLATAEMVKVAANAFLATKISFINAMAEVCEVAGADIVGSDDLIETGLQDAVGSSGTSTVASSARWSEPPTETARIDAAAA